MSRRNSEKWLLVQWLDGSVSVIHIRSLVNTSTEDLQAGQVLSAMVKGVQKTGTLLSQSSDRHLMEQMLAKMKHEEAGPSTEPVQEPGDFSASTSSWEPSDDNATDSDEIESKKVKLDLSKKQRTHERTKKRILTPSHRANAVIPESMKHINTPAIKNYSRKRAHTESVKHTNGDKSLPDSTKKNNSNCEITLQNITIDLNDINGMRECFRDLFQILKNMKTLNCNSIVSERISSIVKDDEINSYDDDKENDGSGSVELNRSDDNILITNKYQKYVGNDTENIVENSNIANASNVADEWVPIGSGKTLLHVEKFRKVNWKSYTIATRTLLCALFPRRVLATHSLTGKRSPAFLNKPAKMCLDPKIISDVIIEIQDRFNVKENLIRSIITTKCADECKMYKARLEKRKSTLAVKNENAENGSNEDINNRTS